ncbi:hypothetical protein A9Q84_14525 [Halobacteriovorax marinus]|uniref:Uncharacterized protein n=1 Tax=Halobacteriovorax marinus TaxID=97084 RepID=A0A1Y5FAC9_9BACT|nr:hypothetical protein A9Q84_14525 [Halobacteriovorax marinus]
MLDLFDFLFEGSEEIEFETIEGGIEVDSGIHDVLGESNEDQVLFALNRMTNDVDESTLEEAAEYFKNASYSQDSFNGIISNLKGIHGEVQVLEELEMRPDFEANYVIPTSTSHEAVDIYGVDEHGTILEKYQVKMSLDKSYIQRTLDELPEDVKIICPSEIADEFDDDRIVDVGVKLSHVEANIDDLCEVLATSEPWEAELGPKFDHWIDEDFEFDFGMIG